MSVSLPRARPTSWLPPVCGPISEADQLRRERIMRARKPPGPPALGIECTRCKLDLELERVPYLAHETETGRVRRALLAARDRVGRFLALHRGPSHAIETYAVTQRSLGVLASQILEHVTEGDRR